ncbi:4Fe-4S binding protein [Candidatus Latescibacterota bacterium]
MPKPKAVVKYDKCVPEKCSPSDGMCRAVEVCKHDILKQEEVYESPGGFPAFMCKGCGDCVQACPLEAIVLVNN